MRCFSIPPRQMVILVSLQLIKLVLQQMAQVPSQGRSQQFNHQRIPLLRRHQLLTTPLPSLLRPWRKTHFPTAYMIPPCLLFLKFPNPSISQIVPPTLLFPPLLILMTIFWRTKPSFLLPGRFPQKHLNTNHNRNATAASN